MQDAFPISEPWSAVHTWALLALGAYALGFACFVFMGNRLGKLRPWLAVGLSGIAFAACVMVCLEYTSDAHQSWLWLDLGTNPLFIEIEITDSSLPMLPMVTGITWLVHVFSMKYMEGDPLQGRYWAFLSLFAFAMLLLVLAGDFLLMFMAWELVGLASYFLIGFWNKKPEAGPASQKAFILNRIGDMGFVIALLAMYAWAGHFDPDRFPWPDMPHGVQLTMGFGLIAAALGKSAQFPLQTWLPDAMAGPTPVSSLIHAATMVAAGVYLLLQCVPFLLPLHSVVLAAIGAGTALAAAISALTQTDIKRVLAYSTISQLGLMVMGVGVGAGDYTYFHLLTHACFKCGLFLCAGAVIHQLHRASHDAHIDFDAQDMRWMGGLGRKMPLVAGAYLLCAASLAGLPFFSGFLSKDGLLLIGWTWAESLGGWAWLVPIAAIAASTLTAFYITRQAILVFAGKNRISLQPGKENLLARLPRLSWAMALPLALLSLLSLWVFWSPAHPFHADSFLLHSDAGEPGPAWLPWLLVGLALAAIAVAAVLYRNGPAVANPRHWLLQLSFQHFFIDRLWHGLLAQPVLAFGRMLNWWDEQVVDGLVNSVGAFVVRKRDRLSLSSSAAWHDRNVVDRAVSAAAELAMGLGARLRGLQSGKLQQYLLYSMLAVLILVLGFYYFITAP